MNLWNSLIHCITIYSNSTLLKMNEVVTMQEGKIFHYSHVCLHYIFFEDNSFRSLATPLSIAGTILSIIVPSSHELLKFTDCHVNYIYGIFKTPNDSWAWMLPGFQFNIILDP